jgi:hypothetical protein
VTFVTQLNPYVVCPLASVIQHGNCAAITIIMTLMCSGWLRFTVVKRVCDVTDLHSVLRQVLVATLQYLVNIIWTVRRPANAISM